MVNSGPGNREPFVEAVKSAIERHRMISPGQTVVVAVSGGPDSTALLHSLWRLQNLLDISLVAATMEHGIRGAESELDAAYVLELCRKLGIPCRTEHIDIPSIAKRRHVSTSISARDERHRFLRQVAGEYCLTGAERIALGHTSDDRAETVLMNLLRGAGLDGVCAMPAVQFPIIRPILACTRAQAGDYCSENGLHPRIDSTNEIVDYRRNRVRTELLPHLAAYYNTGVRESLVRLAEITQDDLEVLEYHASKLFGEATIDRNLGGVVLNASILRASPVAMQRRAVRRAIRNIRGELTDIEFDTVERIVGAITGLSSTEITLPRTTGDQIHIRVSGDEVRIWAASSALQKKSWQVSFTVPGEIDLPIGDLRVSADVVSASKALKEYEASTLQLIDRPASKCYFRARDLTKVLRIKSWHPGDRIHPKGLSGTKKLQDLYTDCKVPRSERDCVPVVVSGDDGDLIVAALGVRCSNLALNAVELGELAVSEPDEPITVIRLVKTVENIAG